MATLQPTADDTYIRLQRLLTQEDADLLIKAIEAVRHTSAGWGAMQVTLKAGRIDGIEIVSSLKKKKTIAKQKM